MSNGQHQCFAKQESTVHQFIGLICWFCFSFVLAQFCCTVSCSFCLLLCGPLVTGSSSKWGHIQCPINSGRLHLYDPPLLGHAHVWDQADSAAELTYSGRETFSARKRLICYSNRIQLGESVLVLTASDIPFPMLGQAHLSVQCVVWPVAAQLIAASAQHSKNLATPASILLPLLKQCIGCLNVQHFWVMQTAQIRIKHVSQVVP